MVSILIYYLLLVYQLATLTNLIEELDNARKSIDIVTYVGRNSTGSTRHQKGEGS